MNKGIIMEVKKNYAIALNDEGVMDKIMFKENMKVGQKIFYFEEDILRNATNNIHRYNSFIKAFGSIAALFLIVFTFFHTMKPQEAYAVVSLDINPSIQMDVDNKLNIIKVVGVNDDGKNIDFSDIKDISIESGMQKIKDKLEEKNYLKTNKDVLVGYAFVKDGENGDYEKDLVGTIKSTFNTQDVVYVKGDKEAVDEAKKQSISLGRYEAALQVEDQNIKNNIDKAPVKQITASIKDSEENKQPEMEDQKGTTQPDTTNKPVDNSDKPGVKPNTNVSDNPDTNINSGKANDGSNKTEKNDNILEVQPDAPAQNGTNGNTNNNTTTTIPPKDGAISVTPNSGGTENSTTPSKTKDDPGKVLSPDQSKK